MTWSEEDATHHNLRYWFRRKEAELRALGDRGKPLEVSLYLLEKCDEQIDLFSSRCHHKR